MLCQQINQRAPSIFACPGPRGNLRKQAVTLANRQFFLFEQNLLY
jgi:hypothetical protein